MVRTSSAGRRLSWIRLVLASVGGADTRILAKAPVDAAEMTGRGIAALIPALFGGLAALISFRYAYSLPLPAAAAAGAGWAVVVLCFDLSLMTAAPDRGRAVRLRRPRLPDRKGYCRPALGVDISVANNEPVLRSLDVGLAMRRPPRGIACPLTRGRHTFMRNPLGLNQ